MADQPPDPPSSFREALGALHPACPFCTNDRDMELRGHEWFCPCCSRCWEAFNRKDQRLLKAAGIRPD